MITLNHQVVTSRLQKLRENLNAPIVKLDYDFDKLNMDGAVEHIKNLVDSGRLFEYENFLFKNSNGKTFSNINNRPYVFDISPTGELSYKRYKNLVNKPHGIVTCAIWNKAHGYFTDFVNLYPSLVPTVENFFEHYKIDKKKCNQICLVYLDKYLAYHIDFDYLFAFRLNITHSKYLFRFKTIPTGKQDFIVKKFLFPDKNESYDDLLAHIKDYPIFHTYDELQTGKTFIIDSYNYLHDFVPETDSWILSVNLESF